MELNDAIEKVNRKMFDRLRQTTDHLAVYFCKFSIIRSVECAAITVQQAKHFYFFLETSNEALFSKIRKRKRIAL